VVGYSGTPLARKLGIKAGHRVTLVSAPSGFESQLEGLPEPVSIARGARGTADIILLFVERAAELASRFDALARPAWWITRSARWTRSGLACR
jgi:hypothetical protein